MSQHRRSPAESPLDTRVLIAVAGYAVLAVVGTLAAAATSGLVAVVPLFLTAVMLVVAGGLWLSERLL